MKRLTDMEIAIVDHFNLTPNKMAEGDWPILTDVVQFCIHEGYGGLVWDKMSAHAILLEIEKKWLTTEDDSIALEDIATWVLSHYFSRDQLINMTGEAAERYLKEWKYFFGFRKCDGMGEVYISDAIRVLDGIEVQVDDSDEYQYIDVDYLRCTQPFGN